MSKITIDVRSIQIKYKKLEDKIARGVEYKRKRSLSPPTDQTKKHDMKQYDMKQHDTKPVKIEMHNTYINDSNNT